MPNLNTPNLLVRDTALARLERIPGCADELWTRVHRREGRCVMTSRLFLEPFSKVYERLGLAAVARAEIDRHAPESLRLRLTTVALFELLGGVLAEAGAFVHAFYGLDGDSGSDLSDAALARALASRDPLLATDLKERRPSLRRIATLAQEATEPARLRFERPKGSPPTTLEPDRVQLSEQGVSVAKGPRRSWQPLDELAAMILADAAGAIDAIARAAIRSIDDGREVELDLRLEL